MVSVTGWGGDCPRLGELKGREGIVMEGGSDGRRWGLEERDTLLFHNCARAATAVLISD